MDVIVMTGCCLLAVGHFAATALPDEGGHFALLFFGPVIAVVLLPVILLHELGHVGGALLTGRRVHIVRVRPFVLTLRPVQLRIVWRSPTTTLGWVLASPERVARGRRRIDHALFVAGGPLASFAGGGLLALPQDTIARVALASLGLMSVGVGFGNLLSPRATSDGARLRRLVRRRPAAPSPRTAAALWYFGVDRTSWTDWDEVGLRHPRGLAFAHWIDFVGAVAGNRLEDAGAIIERLRQSGAKAGWIDCGSAFLSGLAGEDGPARELIASGAAKSGAGMADLMIASLHLRDGDPASARRVLQPLRRGRAPFLNPVWRQLAERVLSETKPWSAQAPVLSKSAALA